MADPNVKMKFTGDAANAEAAIARLEKRYDALEAKIRNTNATSKRGSKEAGDAVGALAGRFAAIASPIALATTALRLYNDSLKDTEDRQKKVAGTFTTFATYFRQAAINYGGDPGELRKQIAKVSAETGQSQSLVARALSDAFSARGDLSDKQTIDAVKQSLRFAGGIEDAVQPLSGVALDALKILPKGTTPQQAIGLVDSIGQLARVTDTSSVAENVAPAALKLIGNYGDSPQYAAALTASLTQADIDPKGLRTRTLVPALAEQLRERLPDLPTTEARLAAVQADPKLQDAFLNGGKFGRTKFPAASFERQSTPAIEQLIKGGAGARILDNYLTRVPTLEQAGTLFESKISRIDAEESQKIAAAERSLKSGTESLRLKDPTAAFAGVSRESYDTRLQQIGVDYLSRVGTARRLDFSRVFGAGELDAQISATEGLLSSRSSGANAALGGQAALNARQDESIPLLREFLKELVGMRDDLKNLKTDRPRTRETPEPRPRGER